MTQALLPSGLRNTFQYNGDNQRVQRQDSSGLAKLIWDAQDILAETNGGGSTVAQSTLEPGFYGNLISQRQGTNSIFHMFDVLGSTSGLNNSSGATTDTYTYLAFGAANNTSGTTTNDYRFVGRLGYIQETDTSLLFLRARHYGPATQSFLSRDPFLGPQSASVSRKRLIRAYTYAANNPIMMVDPSGKVEYEVSIKPLIFYYQNENILLKTLSLISAAFAWNIKLQVDRADCKVTGVSGIPDKRTFASIRRNFFNPGWVYSGVYRKPIAESLWTLGDDAICEATEGRNGRPSSMKSSGKLMLLSAQAHDEPPGIFIGPEIGVGGFIGVDVEKNDDSIAWQAWYKICAQCPCPNWQKGIVIKLTLYQGPKRDWGADSGFALSKEPPKSLEFFCSSLGCFPMLGKG